MENIAMGRLTLIVAGLLAVIPLAHAQSRPGDQSRADSGNRVEISAGTLDAQTGRSVGRRANALGTTDNDVGAPEATPRICTNCDN